MTDAVVQVPRTAPAVVEEGSAFGGRWPSTGRRRCLFHGPSRLAAAAAAPHRRSPESRPRLEAHGPSDPLFCSWGFREDPSGPSTLSQAK